MASRLLFALVGVAAGATVALVGPRPKGAPVVEPRVLADDLDSRLRELQAGVHARATTLGELPRLAAAVATDAATVRDLTQDELAFRPKPGETISIGQVPRKDGRAGGAPTILLTLPEGGPGLLLQPTGAALRVVDGKLVLSEVVSVVPKARADELTGALAVAWPLDTAPFVARLQREGAAARLTVGQDELAFGTPPSAQATKVVLALSTPAASGLELALFVPLGPPPLSPFWLAGAALALAGLLGSLFVGRGAPATATTTPAAPNGSEATAPPGATAPSAASLSTIERTSTLSGVASTAPGSAGASASPSEIGAQIGRYSIVRKLGSGGMAEVLLARATGEAGFEKLVALKVLHRNFGGVDIVVEHFLDEARLASRLTHPNIVQITDLGKAGDEYFIAMEYVEGSDLERLLRRSVERGEQIPLKVGLAILRKICDGLHAAHTARAPDGKPLDLVHRDVKSANVFIARNGAVKVGDFGIAKANVETRVNKTQTGTVKGTAAYMAPEQRVGKPIDRRADLYAVGAIAYEVLTGQEVNLDLAMLADRGKDGWPHLPKPSTVRLDLPVALDAILWRALAYEAADRYPDCAALEEAFEQVATATGQLASDKAIAQWAETLLDPVNPLDLGQSRSTAG